MKRTAVYLAATALATTFAATAFAQDYYFEEEYTQYAPRTAAMESIDVKANRIGPATPIAVKGTVEGKDGHFLLINRGGETVRAHLLERPDHTLLYSGGMMKKLGVGDRVTVYGTFDKEPGERALVKADAVRDLNTGRLMLTDRGDAKIADMRLPAKLTYNVL